MKKFKENIFKIYRVLRFQSKIFAEHIGENNKYTYLTHVSKNSTLGSYNYIGANTIIANSTINNYCSIGPGCLIGAGHHPLDKIVMTTRIAENLYGHMVDAKKTNIGSDVWIGANSIIKQGLTIGNGSVIGANSVVTKDIAPYSIVVGAPAKHIRYRFEESLIEIIESTNWYNTSPEKAINIIKNIEMNLNNK